VSEIETDFGKERENKEANAQKKSGIFFIEKVLNELIIKSMS
jgi:hypothetical protein